MFRCQNVGKKEKTPNAVKTAMDRANAAFQSANDGKGVIASAITAKGVPAIPSDTFSSLAAKIGQISTGKKMASGTLTPTSTTFTLSGLSFTPNIIVGYVHNSAFFIFSLDNSLGKVSMNGAVGHSMTGTVTHGGATLTSNFTPINQYKWVAIE